MKARWLLWVPFAMFAALLGIAIYGLRAPADRTVYSRMVGQPLPAFALQPMLRGRPGLASTQLRGRPRLINVFASWCVPCAVETPQLLAIRQAGVEVDAIAVRDTPAAVLGFLRQNGDPFHALGDDREAKVQLALGSSGVPESFLVDPAGRIIAQHVGEIRSEEVPVILDAMRKAR